MHCTIFRQENGQNTMGTYCIPDAIRHMHRAIKKEGLTDLNQQNKIHSPCVEMVNISIIFQGRNFDSIYLIVFVNANHE